MKRSRFFGAAVALLATPVALAGFEAVSYHLQNRSNGTLVSSGDLREYLLYVPDSYDAASPTSLVISMHGAGLWPAAHKETSQWNAVADREGFIVVYPSGLAGSGPRVWEANQSDGLVKDVKFISELIDTLRTKYNIDPRRIYANGLSNGGGMSFVLSCTMADRIAAVGLVGSAQLLPFSWCTETKPVPMINFHGTADRATPYHGGRTWIYAKPFPSIPMWTANWARRNGCQPVPTEARVAPDVVRAEYAGCGENAAVVLYTIEGGGHTWPGGGVLPEWFVGPTTQTVDASALMWAFFEAHPLAASHSSQPTANRRLPPHP